MKNYLLLMVLALFGTLSQAQIHAVTENGDEVFLYNDGTWQYADGQELGGKDEIPTNSKPFTKPSSSTFLLKSKILDVGVWLNPRDWSFTKATGNEAAEYEFELKDGDLYGMIITERISMPLPTLKRFAIENAREVAPDLRVVEEEYRTVNGVEVLYLQMNGTMDGVKFSYVGYYYSNDQGSVQMLTFTSQNLLGEYRGKCEELLNGFVKL